MPYIQRQCDAAGIDVNDRLVTVVAHGLCHLIGYTHDTDRSEAKVWAERPQTLGSLALTGKKFTFPGKNFLLF